MILFLLILTTIIECVIFHYVLYKLIGDEKTFKEYLICLFLNKYTFYSEYNIVISLLLFIVFFVLDAGIYNTFIK